ncbi:MAG: orotate phosphoribosyltransferase [Spirochaetes bacterium]|nr:orotate phosphoribosyltransferase [Spirochaetota bacterium]
MDKAMTILKECGAFLEGHFLLSSGKHSNVYIQCAKLFQHPDKAAAAMAAVAEKIRQDMQSGGLAVDAVAGPAIGGILPAYELGRQLGLPAFFTERDDGGVMRLRRGFELKPGQRVVIVEDVVTTGKSSLECAKALEAEGAAVAGLACVVDRRLAGEADMPWPFYPAVKVAAGNWEAADCDLCKQGTPAVKPGSRKA